MKLNGNDLQQLVNAMLQAYSNKSDLEQMVRFKLDQSLDEIAGGKTIRDIVFNLINWAESRGKLQDLLNAVSQERPDNSNLQNIVNELLAKYFVKTSNNQVIIKQEKLVILRENDPNFVGRASAIADIDNLIQNHSQVILIQSPGGVGKTLLAQKYLRNRFQTIIEFRIAKETKDIASVESLLEEKLRQLGEEPGREFMVSLDRLKQKLQTQPIGILIDNLEPALDDSGQFISQHRSYLELLRVLTDSSLQSITLITSRERLCEGLDITPYPLPSLTVEAWREYWHYQKINPDTAILTEIHQVFGGNALAMKVLCNPILKDFQGDITAYWQENKTEDGLMIENEVSNLIKKQFERLAQIHPDAYKLLCRMGCYRYQDVPTVPEAGLICLLWDVAKNKHKKIIKVLKEQALVEFNNGEYSLHPVIREEAIERLRNSEDWEKANTQAAEFYISKDDNFLRVKYLFEAIDHYYINEAFDICCEILLYEILESKNNLSNLRCHVNLWNSITRIIDIGEKLIAENININNSNLQILVRIVVSLCYTEQGKNKKSIDILNKNLDILSQTMLIEKYKIELHFGEVVSNIILSRSYRMIGNYTKSNQYCSQATKLSKSYKQRECEALALYELGLLYLETNHPGRACRCIISAAFQAINHRKIPVKIYQLVKKSFIKDEMINNIFNEYNQGTIVAEDQTKKFRILFNTAKAFYLMEMIDISKILFNMSKKFIPETDEINQTWITLMNVNYSLQTKKKDKEKIENLFKNAFKHSEKASSLCQCTVLLEYSKWKYEQELYNEFLELAENQLEPLLNKTEFEGWKAENYERLALTYQAMGDQAKAQEYFNKAIYLWSPEQIDAPKQIERVKKAMNCD